MSPRLIALDWGTSALRAWRLGDGGAIAGDGQIVVIGSQSILGRFRMRRRLCVPRMEADLISDEAQLGVAEARKAFVRTRGEPLVYPPLPNKGLAPLVNPLFAEDRR